MNERDRIVEVGRESGESLPTETVVRYEAANAIIDFIGRDVMPKVQEAPARGGPPAGY